MSKYNMLMGYASGKLGDMVMYHSRGHENQRAYNPNPKNPRSEAQMLQRAQLAPIISFFQASKQLLDHSFTARPINQSSYNSFVQMNLNREPRLFFTKQQAISHASVVAPYQISSGTLPPILHAAQSTAGTLSLFSSISVGLEATTTTVGNFSQAILENNEGWAEGDQLSFVYWEQNVNNVTGEPYVIMKLYEMKLNINSGAEIPIPARFRTIGDSTVLGQALIYANMLSSVDGGCYIHSRKDENGKLQSSTQAVELISNAGYQPYASEEMALQAIESYKYSPEKFLVPGGSTSGREPIAQMHISGVFISDATIPTYEDNYTIQINANFRIVGEQLTVDGLKMLVSASSSLTNEVIMSTAQPIATYISEAQVTSTGSVFTGIFSNNIQNVRLVAIVGGTTTSPVMLYKQVITPSTTPPPYEMGRRLRGANGDVILREQNEETKAENIADLEKMKKQINKEIDKAKKEISNNE